MMIKHLKKFKGHKLIVQGRSKLTPTNDYSREFTRSFTLPSDVDQYSIRAQLDEETRLLSLIGDIVDEPQRSGTSGLGSSSSYSSSKIGTVREKRIISANAINYEIYLGNDLKGGKVNVNVSRDKLIVKVNNKDSDKYGDLSLELERRIDLPKDAIVDRIEHNIDTITSNLIVKVPLE
jgi:hypothetical protein